ncbi:23S rRNA (pseudouridine(1915)-N(3))-methyltransferase RlmH [Geovibrio thiophilus]|uniref:Ribosomal RNA large subunit methyltransferase H n=1 Tax=Geovibrio thiophilus TaxID=139438 RepID=A0A410JW94_9BACT|nr:23S rRNA (pseudouridine(1915)-N(3))-methyltransferase RlmH [Geovibrio thiophilus]QAR32329.1 23S rRNA (pseudouridine(1915)-N(3))-methyltransferase RlmH [Geovibrio thiophilus]
MKLKIVMSSRIRDKAVDELTAEYVKRMGAYAECSVVEAFSPNKAKQLPLLLKAGEGMLVGMDPKGKRFTSEKFAAWLEKKLEEYGGVTFFIGEADGLHEELKARLDDTVSLSDMTMAHRISLVVLAEQLYRALTIIKGHPYHK